MSATCTLYSLPRDVLLNRIFVCLTKGDLQKLHEVFYAHQLPLLQSYIYTSNSDSPIVLKDLRWLRDVGITVVGLNLPFDIHAQQVKFIARSFPGLRSICISDCLRNTYTWFTDDILIQLAHGCVQLESLHLPFYASVTDVGLIGLVQTCEQLRHIKFEGISITDDGIRALCYNSPNMQHIDISYCSSLTDESLIAIANTYPQLQCISLKRCNFTENGLISFVNQCHALRSVNICRDNITSSGLAALWAANPYLTAVDVSDNSWLLDDDITALLRNCPHVKILDLYNCNNITDDAVIDAAERCDLSSLNVSSCAELTDISLIALGRHCHGLKSIDLSWNHDITDEGLVALATGCPLWKEIDMSYVCVSDIGVSVLASSCPDLRKIIASACQLIGLSAITAIAEKCPLLSELNVASCANVNDACLYMIAQHCRNLTRLYVSNVSETAIKAVLLSCRSCTVG